MTEINLAIEKALLTDESRLLETLGARLQAIESNPSLAGSYEITLPYAQPEEFRETVKELGERTLHRLSRELYKLLCGKKQDDEDDRNKIAHALGLGEAEIAATLATILTSGFGVSPAIAIIVAVIVVKRIFAPTLEEACNLWEEKLPSQA
jgi:hypothetical protein